MQSNDDHKYSLTIRLLHWVITPTILGLLISGYIMTRLAKEIPYKYDIYFYHKSFGVIILILAIARLINRLFTKTPNYPTSISLTEIILAKIIHILLYMVMIFVPLSGYLMSSLGGHPVFLFLYKLPNFITENKEYAEFFWKYHSILAYTLLVFVTLHIGATLKHLIFDKINLLKRII